MSEDVEEGPEGQGKGQEERQREGKEKEEMTHHFKKACIYNHSFMYDTKFSNL